MNFRIGVKFLSAVANRTVTYAGTPNWSTQRIFNVKPTNFYGTFTWLVNTTLRSSCLSRTLSISCVRRDEDDITTEQMNEMLQHDTELQSMLKDIMKDFDPNPPPPEPPKVRQQSEIEMDSQHDPHYKEDDNESNKISLSLLQRYKQYEDKDSTIILDVDEEQKVDKQEFYLYQEKKDRLSGLDLKRGRKGVFELPELVKVLQDENIQDLAVVGIPKEMQYTDYLIIGNAKSPRHSRAVMEFLLKLYKLKKSTKDPFLRVEGENCHEWKVLDMGNIIVHVFLPQLREKYDLETLWTVGEKFDDLCHQPEDPFYNTLEREMQLLEAAQRQVNTQ